VRYHILPAAAYHQIGHIPITPYRRYRDEHALASLRLPVYQDETCLYKFDTRKRDLFFPTVTTSKAKRDVQLSSWRLRHRQLYQRPRYVGNSSIEQVVALAKDAKSTSLEICKKIDDAILINPPCGIAAGERI